MPQRPATQLLLREELLDGNTPPLSHELPKVLSPGFRFRLCACQTITPGLPPPPAERPPMGLRGAVLKDARALIATLDEVDLSRFCIMGI